MSWPMLMFLAQQQPSGPAGRGPIWGSDLILPIVLLVLVFGAAIVAVAVKRHRQLRFKAAFDHLMQHGGFARVEDRERRAQLSESAGWVFADDDFGGPPPVRLKYAVAYRGDDFTVSVVALGATHPHGADHLKIDSPVVICDGFDAEMPPFHLLPANFLLRRGTDPPAFSPETAFGRSNLVFSEEHERTRHILDEQAQTLLDGNNMLALYAAPDQLVMYRHDLQMRGEEIEAFVQECATLASILHDNARTMPAELDSETR